MNRFVSKPKEVSAVQFDGTNVEEIQEWIGDTYYDEDGTEQDTFRKMGSGNAYLYVSLLDELVNVPVEGWVLKRDGQFIYQPDESFRELYVPMDEEADAALEEHAEATMEAQEDFGAVLADADLREELAEVLTKNKRLEVSGTPDYVLAHFVMGSLEIFEESIKMRASSRLERWEFDTPTNNDQN